MQQLLSIALLAVCGLLLLANFNDVKNSRKNNG